MTIPLTYEQRRFKVSEIDNVIRTFKGLCSRAELLRQAIEKFQKNAEQGTMDTMLKGCKDLQDYIERINKEANEPKG